MCPTITVGSFFRHEWSSFLFNNVKPQQLESQKRVQNEKKKQNRRIMIVTDHDFPPPFLVGAF